MGVPTITLAGQAFFERLSFSTLSNAGLADLAGTDHEGYVSAALRLAADGARRRDLRRTLRQRIGKSPLGNNAAWVSEFQSRLCTITSISS
jgi:protein O-GlcNAc transferase